MQIIDFLKSHPNEDAAITALIAETGIKVKLYDHHIMLNYDQIESPKSHPLVIECRSLILNRSDYSVASRSFDRFFNYGEMLEYNQDFDWDNAQIFEKADGSIIKVWYNTIADRWEISTRGSAFGEVEHTMGGTFREKVLAAFGANEEVFQEVFSLAPLKYTYIFEYTGPENRIVTRYEKSEMVLLSVRTFNGEYLNYTQLGLEADVYAANGLNVRVVKKYDASNPDDVVKMASELPALEEGYVAWDGKKRIKIKNPSYVAIHKIRDNGQLSPKRIAALVLENDEEEYLAYFPEDRVFFEPYVKSHESIKQAIAVVYDEFKNIESQKDFALGVKDYAFSGVLFNARKLKISSTEAWNQSAVDYKTKILIENVELAS